MADEQELRDFIIHLLEDKDAHFTANWVVAQYIIAKLKALGWTPPCKGTGEKKLVPKTPEAEKTHQEFLKRCAVDLKKLDNPDREKIARWFYSRYAESMGFTTKWEDVSPVAQDGYFEEADQIIALIEPLIRQRVYGETRRQRDKRKALREWCYKKIKDAGEQERKRIIDVMYSISAWTSETSQYRDMIEQEILKEE